MTNPSTRCGKCSYVNRARARFCIHCGADLATTPASVPTVASAVGTAERCPGCGQDITPGARFCRNCGKTVALTSKPRTDEAGARAPPSPPVGAAPSVVAETLAQPRGNSASSPVHPAASIAEAPLPATASRFAFPVWAWTLFGFFIGLLTGVGVLWAQPALLNWASAPTQATVEPAPSGSSSKTSTPGTTVTPDGVLTATYAPLTATVPITGTRSAKLPLSGTKSSTATIKRITP